MPAKNLPNGKRDFIIIKTDMAVKGENCLKIS